MGTCLYTHFLPYEPNQLYDLVADIEKYPEFLPWCVGASILSQSATQVVADLSIGYKFFRDAFRSCVHLTPKRRIEVEYISGPFQYLKNYWVFEEVQGHGTEIEFFIDFEFRSSIFQSLAQMAFESAFSQMLNSFEKRAHHLYGNKFEC